MNKQKSYNVYLHDKSIDTVHFSRALSIDEVKPNNNAY